MVAESQRRPHQLPHECGSENEGVRDKPTEVLEPVPSEAKSWRLSDARWSRGRDFFYPRSACDSLPFHAPLNTAPLAKPSEPASSAMDAPSLTMPALIAPMFVETT